MSNSKGERPLDCRQAREDIHTMLDGDLVDADLRQRSRSHLAECAECREFDADLRETQRMLRSVPELVLPQTGLQEILDTTVRSIDSARRSKVSGWRQFAAAAAVLIVSTLWVWQSRESGPGEPTDEELRRAAADVRMALGLTSGAIRKTQQAAIRDILVDEVSPALKRVPIAWPDLGPAPQREM